MSVMILIGAQWGDEGKGRYVDWFASHADIVARYGGGDNAGHTVAIGDTVYKLHLVPSGILHERVVAVMGNGMVINPLNLLKEMDDLSAMGITINPARLMISSRAHMITPAHLALDRAKELARGKDAIGTTLRGIGPAYLDKADRKGIRLGDMLDIERFADTLQMAIASTNETLIALGADPLDPDASIQAYVDAAHRLKPYIHETAFYLHQRLREGAKVVCEGAQGTLLDVDHGSYPFVTSSATTVGGAITGLGISPMSVDRIIGVAKAFSTRVGGGPMPTEQHNEIGARLRGTGEHFWDEYGTTTGRPRRCGWLDAVMLRYSTVVNGFTELVLTKLDVLSGFETLQIAVAYDVDGQRYEFPPSTTNELERATPIYETLPGWQQNLSAITQAGDLPSELIAYVQRIEALCGVPIRMASVGPERSQMVTFS